MANWEKTKYLLQNLVNKQKCAKKIRKLQQIIHFLKEFVQKAKNLCKISSQNLCNLRAFVIGFP